MSAPAPQLTRPSGAVRDEIGAPAPCLPESRPAAPAARAVSGWLASGVSLVPLLSAVAGLAIVGYLLSHYQWREMVQAFSSIWLGIAAVVVCHSLPLLLDTLSWTVLFPEGTAPLRKMFWVRWIGEAASNLMPAASLGGDLVRTRWAVGPGVPLLFSGATVVVNITVGVLTQVGFTVLGMSLLAWRTGEGLGDFPTGKALLLSLSMAGSFWALQRFGIFRLLRAITLPVAGVAWLDTLLAKGEKVDVAIQQIYGNRKAILRCLAWSAAYWISGSTEIWLAMEALGCASWQKAIILEAAVQGVRSAAFFLPGGLGAQEGGYLLAGNFLGLPAEAALALSMIRRIRELAWGIPGLIVWQVLEIRRKVSAGRWVPPELAPTSLDKAAPTG